MGATAYISNPRYRRVLSRAAQGARARGVGHLGSLMVTRMARSHIHKPSRAAHTVWARAVGHLGSLMMTRMACSHVHSLPHLTDASSSLNASLASSCRAAGKRQLYGPQIVQLPTLSCQWAWLSPPILPSQHARDL